MTTLRSKTIFITGGSRGIGRAIAHRAAADGARIVIAAKTDTPHPKLGGTVHTVAQEIIELGGEALPLVVDVRDDGALVDAVAVAVERFGGIDVLVNNASALNLSKTLDLPMNRFDLMFDINVRGTFAATKACLPHLKTAQNPHVLTLSPGYAHALKKPTILLAERGKALPFDVSGYRCLFYENTIGVGPAPRDRARTLCRQR